MIMSKNFNSIVWGFLYPSRGCSTFLNTEIESGTGERKTHGSLRLEYLDASIIPGYLAPQA